jgi:hypothetical protein
VYHKNGSNVKIHRPDFGSSFSIENVSTKIDMAKKTASYFDMAIKNERHIDVTNKNQHHRTITGLIKFDYFRDMRGAMPRNYEQHGRSIPKLCAFRSGRSYTRSHPHSSCIGG